MTEVRTRFAPSPTGYLHIGNLRTALYAYLLARRYDGKFILRIEDTDQKRYIEGATEVVYNALRITGLKHDEGPDIGGPYGPYVQSERKPIYKKYAEELVEIGGAYYCFCAQEGRDGTAPRLGRHHDLCRHIDPKEAAERVAKGEEHVIRQRIPESGSTTIVDAVFGSITVENSTLDESVLMKSDGLPTYNFANVVDDHLMRISHVMRGVEYIPSAPKYELIYRAYGWQNPIQVHLPHITKEGGKKLSKRTGDAAFEDLYERGYLIEAIVNYIVLLGWNPGTEQEVFSLSELERVFGVEGLSKSSAMFDIKKLNWLNGEYIRKKSPEEFHSLALPYIRQAIPCDTVDTKAVASMLHDRTEILGDIPESLDFLAQLPDYDVSMYVHKKMKTDIPSSLSNLSAALDALKSLEEWTHNSVTLVLKNTVEKLRVKNGQVLWPLRIALSGKQRTPGGGIEIAVALGKHETLKRVETGLAKLRAEAEKASV